MPPKGDVEENDALVYLELPYVLRFFMTGILRSAVGNVLRNDDFHKFCDATPPEFIRSHIGERKVNEKVHNTSHFTKVVHNTHQSIQCPLANKTHRRKNFWEVKYLNIFFFFSTMYTENLPCLSPFV